MGLPRILRVFARLALQVVRSGRRCLGIASRARAGASAIDGCDRPTSVVRPGQSAGCRTIPAPAACPRVLDSSRDLKRTSGSGDQRTLPTRTDAVAIVSPGAPGRRRSRSAAFAPVSPGDGRPRAPHDHPGAMTPKTFLKVMDEGCH